MKIEQTDKNLLVFCEIFGVLFDRVAGYKGLMPHFLYDVTSWYVATTVLHNISTDDTIQFTHNCRIVQTSIEGLYFSNTCFVLLPDSIKARQLSVLNCMKAAFKLYRREWARPPLDILFRTAANARLFFDDDMRPILDDMTTAITLEQRSLASGINTHTIRTYDSIAHPLRKNEKGILR